MKHSYILASRQSGVTTKLINKINKISDSEEFGDGSIIFVTLTKDCSDNFKKRFNNNEKISFKNDSSVVSLTFDEIKKIKYIFVDNFLFHNDLFFETLFYIASINKDICFVLGCTGKGNLKSDSLDRFLNYIRPTYECKIKLDTQYLKYSFIDGNPVSIKSDIINDRIIQKEFLLK